MRICGGELEELWYQKEEWTLGGVVLGLKLELDLAIERVRIKLGLGLHQKITKITWRVKNKEEKWNIQLL